MNINRNGATRGSLPSDPSPANAVRPPPNEYFKIISNLEHLFFLSIYGTLYMGPFISFWPPLSGRLFQDRFPLGGSHVFILKSRAFAEWLAAHDDLAIAFINALAGLRWTRFQKNRGDSFSMIIKQPDILENLSF